MPKSFSLDEISAPKAEPRSFSLDEISTPTKAIGKSEGFINDSSRSVAAGVLELPAGIAGIGDVFVGNAFGPSRASAERSISGDYFDLPDIRSEMRDRPRFGERFVDTLERTTTSAIPSRKEINVADVDRRIADRQKSIEKERNERGAFERFIKDRPFDKATDAVGDFTGFKPKSWAEGLLAGQSDELLGQRRAADQLWKDKASGDAGWSDVLGFYSTNPNLTFQNVLQSLPSMYAGARIGRGLGPVTAETNLLARAAIGEGAIMAGQSMENIDKSVPADEAAAASLVVGLGGGALGFGGGKLASKLGLGDVDTALVRGVNSGVNTATGATQRGVVSRVTGGAISEGFFEELPQSLLEQGAKNLAEGKPFTEGMDRAGLEGTLAGMTMGGAFNIRKPRGNDADLSSGINNSTTSSGTTSSTTGPLDPSEPSFTSREAALRTLNRLPNATSLEIVEVDDGWRILPKSTTTASTSPLGQSNQSYIFDSPQAAQRAFNRLSDEQKTRLQINDMGDGRFAISPRSAIPSSGTSTVAPWESDPNNPNEFKTSLFEDAKAKADAQVAANQQRVDTSVSNAGQQAVNQAAQQQAAQQQTEADQARIEQLSQGYGVTPASNIANTWDVAGGRIYGQPALTKFLAELADLTKGMTPIQQKLHNVALAAGMVQFKGKPINAKSLVGQLNKGLEAVNIAHVADLSEAAEILNDQISQMVAAGKGAQDTTLSKLASLYENITGEESDAYKLAQQPKETKSKKEKAGTGQASDQGKSGPVRVIQGEELQQLLATEGQEGDTAPTAPKPRFQRVTPEAQRAYEQQSQPIGGQDALSGQNEATAGVGAVSEQSQSAGADGGVQPGIVQPVQSGSVAQGSPSVQTGSSTGEGIRDAETRDAVDGRTDGGNEKAKIDEREQLVKRLLVEAFGTRDAEIILEVFKNELSKAEIGKKYGLSQQRVDQIAGPRAQETWFARIQIAARRLGLGDDAIARLLENAYVEESAEEIVDDRADFATGQEEAADDSTPSFSDEQSVNDAELDQAEAFGDEERGVAQGMGVIGSEGGSQSNWKDTGDITDQYLKAIEDGDLEKAQLLADKLQKQTKKLSTAKQEKPGVSKAVKTQQAETQGRKEKTRQPSTEVSAPAVTADQAWDKVAAEVPGLPNFASLSQDDQQTFKEFGPENWTRADVVKFAQDQSLVAQQRTTNARTPALQDDSRTIDGSNLITEKGETEQRLLIARQTNKLTNGQTERLEQHYGAKANTEEFFQKLREDVINYVTKGAEAVSAKIRDIVKQISSGVLAAAVVFNSMNVTVPQAVAIPKYETRTETVMQEPPAQAADEMSEAAKQAYRVLYPALKEQLQADNNFLVITDKPNARVFIFNPDGSLFMKSKVLLGRTVGDFYKGKTGIVANRITPAGLFTLGLRDAKRGITEYGGNEAATAGEYDFGKVFVLDKALDGKASVTLFHSVWLKETDAKQRQAALKEQSAANSRYSFGCINLPKDLFGKLVTGETEQMMDGAKMFVVPDAAETTMDFINGDVAGKDELTRTKVEPKTETKKVKVSGDQQQTPTRPEDSKEQAPARPEDAKAVTERKTQSQSKSKAQFSKGKQAVSPEDAYTADELTEELTRFMRTDTLGNNVIIVDDVTELSDLKDITQGKTNPDAFAWTRDGQAILIASRIPRGQGRALFLHEVGSHLGLQRLLPGRTFNQLVAQVKTWANSNSNLLESRVARAAVARAEAARDKDTTERDFNDEVLAYFIEEAVLAGVEPSNKGVKPIDRWFRKLWAAFKEAVRKIGMDPDKLTGQDIVNLAFGAARLEVNGVFQGSAAEFRNFRNAYVGTGEGAVVRGWGHYAAQKFGVAKSYMLSDIERKNNRTVLLDGKPLSEILEALQSDSKSWGTDEYSLVSAMGIAVKKLAQYKNIYATATPAKLKETILDDTQKELENYLEREKKFLADLERVKKSSALTEYSIARGEKVLAAFKNNRKQYAESLEVRVTEPAGSIKRADIMYSKSDLLFLDRKLRSQPKILEKLKKLPKEIIDRVEYLERDSLEDLTGDTLRLRLEQADGLVYDVLNIKNRNVFDEYSSVNRFASPEFLVSLLFKQLGIPGSYHLDQNSRYKEKLFDDLDEARAQLEDAKNNGNTSDEEIAGLKEQVLDLQEAVRTLTVNTVMFDERSMQRVTSLVPTVQDGKSGYRVQYSKNNRQQQPRRTRIQGAIDKLPNFMRRSTQHLYDTLAGDNRVTRFQSLINFTRDLTDKAAKFGLPAAQTYQRLDDAKKTVLGRYSADIENVIAKFNKLPESLKGIGKGSVNALIKDITIEGKWAFQPSWLSDKVVIDDALKERFDDMPDLAQDVIRSVFEFNWRINSEMKTVVLENIKSEFDARIADAKKANDKKAEADLLKEKSDSLARFQTLLRINAKTPYASLKRFGNYVVVAKSQRYMDAEDNKDAAEIKRLETLENHYVVRFAETIGEAKDIYRKLEGKYDYLSEPFDSAEADQSVYGGRDVNALFYRLRNAAEKTPGSSAATKQLNSMLNALQLKLLAEQSARHSENRRKNITGADPDMMRSFVTQGRASAHFVASLTNSGKIYDALAEMKKERDAKTPGKDVRSIFYNEIMKRHLMGLHYDPSPITDAALTTTSLWMLLTSPKYFAQNFIQPAVLSQPYIGGEFGYTKTGAAFSKAYKEATILMAANGLTEDAVKKLPADVRTAIQTLIDRGRLNISLGQELGRFRSNVSDNADLVEAGIDKFGKGTDFLRTVAERVEAVNRVTTAITAYRMHFAKNGSVDKAIDYADKVVYATHGDYSGANAPRVLRTSAGRIVGQFRKFQLIQLALISRMWSDFREGATKEERYVAAKQLTYTMSHMLALGGIMSLPGFATIAWWLGAFGAGGDDEPDDPEMTLRRMIGDKETADLLLKGVPAWAGVDISASVGMGNVLSVSPYSEFKFNRDDYAKGLMGMAGPFAGGVVPNLIDGVNYMKDGNYYRGLETMMPKGIKDAMKGYRFATEGVTNRKGDVLIKPEDVSAYDATLQALGLPTTNITDQYKKNQVRAETVEFYNDKTSALKKKYIEAYKDGDAQKMGELRTEFMELQAAKHRNGFKRQPMSDLLRAPREQRKRERKTIDGVQYNRGNRRFAQKLANEFDEDDDDNNNQIDNPFTDPVDRLRFDRMSPIEKEQYLNQ
jgi:hypothetical protein